MNDVQSSQSLPANKVRHCLIHHIAVHANANCDPRELAHLKTNTQIFPKITACRFKEGRLYNKSRRYIEVVAPISMHISRIFQYSLVSLTGSDVAILTVEMFCPFSSSASHSNHSHTYGSRLSPRRGG